MRPRRRTGLLAELQRRKVIRVAVVYAASAFVVLQAADLMLPALMLPEWTYRLLVLLALLGFPIAIGLAWALEMTADGVRVTARRTGAHDDEPPPSLLGRRTVIAASLLTVLGVGLGAGWFLRPVTGAGADRTNGAPDKSIAVLPFADFSPGGDHDWFADGLAEEILNALARLPDLRVASRTGSFQYREQGADVAAIAASLGVAHILEGSVRRAGDQVRITAQLIRARDNAHLWSQTFDRDAADVIRVQEEIAYEIARTLRTALDPEQLARMVAAGTNSVAAHEAFLRYWHLMHRGSELEDWRLALEAYDRLEAARSLDPQFFRAHARAADFWINQMTPTTRWYGVTDLRYQERLGKAVEALTAAEATAPDEASRLEAERTRAQLDVRLRDVLALSQRIVRLNPSADEWLILGISAIAIGQYDVARDAFRRAAARREDLRWGTASLAQYYQRVDPAAALELVDSLLQDDVTNLEDLYQAHRVLLTGDRVEQAAGIAEQYLARSTERIGTVLVRIRQLCAEGRSAEAERYFASLDAGGDLDVVARWHALIYLGRSTDAAEVLRPLDDAGELFVLSTFLVYTFFDPRPFPKLSATLRRHGALRAEPLPIPYACPATTRNGGPDR
jgi:TolB-like protein